MVENPISRPIQRKQDWDEPVRVLFLALHLRHGGVEKAIIQQANYLAGLGCAVEIACTYNLGEPAYELDSSVQIDYLTDCKPNREAFHQALHEKRWICLFREGVRALRTLILKRRTLQRKIRHNTADRVIYTRHEQALLFAKWHRRHRRKYKRLYPQQQNIVFLHHDHEWDFDFLQEILRYYGELDDFVLLLPQLEEEFRALFAQAPRAPRMWTLGNFLFEKEIPHLEQLKKPSHKDWKKTNFCWIGRMEEEKQPMEALQAYAKAYFEARKEAGNQLKWKLTFCGDGSLKKELEDWAQENLPKETVEFCGMVGAKTIQEKLLESQLLLLTSRTEGFGLVFLEAFAAGTPVLAFDCRVAPRALIAEGIEGWLVDPEEGIEGYASKLYRIVRNDFKGIYLNNLLQKAHWYSDERIGLNLEEILKQGPKREASLFAMKPLVDLCPLNWKEESPYELGDRLLRSSVQPSCSEYIRTEGSRYETVEQRIWRLLLAAQNETWEELETELDAHFARENSGNLHYLTVNPEIAVLFAREECNFEAFFTADKRILADGQGYLMGRKKLLQIAASYPEFALRYVPSKGMPTALLQEGKIQKSYLKSLHTLPGVEACSHMIFYAEQKGKTVYFYGARPEVLEALLVQMKKKYPKLKIAGSAHGFQEDREEIQKEILQLKPDFIFVALGAPLQEEFCAQLGKKLSRSVLMGVGGSFDVLSGKKIRAPLIFRKLRLEWLWRLGREPQRLKRFMRSLLVYMKSLHRAKREARMIQKEKRLLDQEFSL